MTEMTKTPNRTIRGVVGCFAFFFLAMSLLCMLPMGIYGLLGRGTEQSLVCDRASGDCTLHDSIDRPIRLETIRSVETICDDVHVATNTNEWQCWIRATLSTGTTQTFSDGTGNEASQAELHAATDRINAFLAGTAPTLRVTYTVRDGTTSIFNELMLGVFGLVAGVVSAYWFWKTRRPG